MEHEETKENLARLEHEQWTHWMEYMYSLCVQDTEGNYIIPKEKAERWLRQMKTKYKDLPESEKRSDREWAQKSLKVIKFEKLLKEEQEFGRELGVNCILSVLLDQRKITQDDFVKLQ